MSGVGKFFLVAVSIGLLREGCIHSAFPLESPAACYPNNNTPPTTHTHTACAYDRNQEDLSVCLVQNQVHTHMFTQPEPEHIAQGHTQHTNTHTPLSGDKHERRLTMPKKNIMTSPLSSVKVIAHSQPPNLEVQHPEVTSPLLAISKGEPRLAILMFSAMEPPPPPQATLACIQEW